MALDNVKFKIVSLNARGLRSLTKRKAIMMWLRKQKADIAFLQETYSTKDVENVWRSQWNGSLFFSHGTEHARGVLVYVRKDLDFQLKSLHTDANGRFILLETIIQDTPFFLCNIYSPNNSIDQVNFFADIKDLLLENIVESNSNVILGGDFNMTFDTDLDCYGGSPKIKECVKIVKDILYDLVDIWRIRNFNKHRYTWRNSSSKILRRLDFWLISDNLQEDIKQTEIGPSMKSDHSLISLEFDSVRDQKHGPSFWKLNTSLLDDSEYVNMINTEYPNWLREFEEITDKRVLWDLIKYRIRQVSIAYSKDKQKNRRNVFKKLMLELKQAEEACDQDPTDENIQKRECLKLRIESLSEYIVKGSIIRSRVNWYEQGEKNNKYFLNLENNNKGKRCIRNISIQGTDVFTSDPRKIMSEIKDFFSELYAERETSDELADLFLGDSNIPQLDEDEKEICEGHLSVGECYNALLSMSDNKTPGNDGLPAEFYKRFWPLLGNQLVQCLNFAFENDHLSNSQMQAVITLLQKKDRDKRFIKNWRPISLINVDAKIGSKSLARRMCKVLPNIIHPDQCAYVKDRLISDAIRTIDDVMWYTRSRGIEGMLVAIDFEKAFDSVDLKFLIRVLEVFNFDPNFIQWIKTFYNGAKSCVINNGYTSHYFDLERGVR